MKGSPCLFSHMAGALKCSNKICNPKYDTQLYICKTRDHQRDNQESASQYGLHSLKFGGWHFWNYLLPSIKKSTVNSQEIIS